jgi:hypothetical protein
MAGRVFLVNLIVGKQDMNLVARWGEPRIILSADHFQKNSEPALPRITEALCDFDADDWLMPYNHPIFVAWACAIAARQSGGFLRLLKWNVGHNEFRETSKRLWDV